MFTKDIFIFLIKVISSWQIIFITIALVLYFTLVSYVARLYHPRRGGFSFDSKPRKSKEKTVAAELPESGDDDDLGIE